MLFAQLLLTLLLLAICCFAPGFFFVRKLAWSGLEKVCGSVALSLVLLWLAVWAIYVIAPGTQPGAWFVVAALCCAAAAFTWRDAVRLWHSARVRRALGGFAFLVVWMLLVLAAIRVYSGAIWSGDWAEHFQRTLFFLHHFPKTTPVYGDYLLPARPPMMNVIAAFFLGLTQDRYEIFQLVFAVLNVLLFLPCCLAIPLVARVRKVRVLPLVAVFALNPAVVQNATYTWTKSLTAFFVVFAIWLYLAGWRKRDSLRMTAAFVCLAAGLLVHYSAGPYCVFFALHYLIVVMRTRSKPWREFAAIAATSGVLLVTWFGWSIATYGTAATFASNTTITASQGYEGSNLEKVVGNLFDSFVPQIFVDPAKLHTYDQPYRPAFIRDHAFSIYQTNAIFMMGSVGGLVAVWLLVAALLNGRGRERAFWSWLIAWSVLVGIASSGERDYFGVAHLTLIPLEALGLTLLAANALRRRWVAFAVVAGCVLDFALGVMLHVWIEHKENSPQHQYYAGATVDGNLFQIGIALPESISGGAWRNWFTKYQPRLCNQWLQWEESYHPEDPALQVSRPDFRQAMREKLAEDDKYWGGWYRRHGGVMGFLGDGLGESPMALILLVIGAAGLLIQLVRRAPRTKGKRVEAMKSVRAKGKR